jgi:hypothetical protein
MKQFQQIINSVLVTTCFLSINLNLSALNIEQLYVGIPDALDPTMSKQNRVELVAYFKAHQGDSIKNLFNNKVILTKLDTVYQHLIIKYSSCSTFEMKLIQRPDSLPIVGIIHTICGPVCQSRIEFYDTAWHQLLLEFKMPKSKDWVNASALNQTSLDSSWVKNLLKDSYITLRFEDVTQSIVANCNSLEFLGEEDKKSLSFLLMGRPLVYKLMGRKWVLETTTK